MMVMVNRPQQAFAKIEDGKEIKELTNGAFTMTKTGLQIHGRPEYSEWLGYGQYLLFVHDHIQMAIGDWLNYGEHRWGEKYSQAVLETGYENATLRDYAYVASHVQMSLRNDKLFFGHYKVIAPLKTDEGETDCVKQAYYLQKAVRGKWSVAKLRSEVNAAQPSSRYYLAKNAPARVVSCTPDGDGYKLALEVGLETAYQGNEVFVYVMAVGGQNTGVL